MKKTTYKEQIAEMINMTNEKVKDMIKMRLNGATIQEIGDKCGVSYEVVRQFLPDALRRDYRIEKGYGNVVYPALRKWLIKNKVSKTQFAKKVGISHQNIDRFLLGKSRARKSTIDKILAITGLTYEQAFATEEQK